MASAKCALVTGANRGLGFEIARQLGGRGYRVLVAARDPARGEDAAARLRKVGIDAQFIELDAADSASITGAVATVSALVPALDVLVNNAGTFLEPWTGRASEITTEQMRGTFAVNFFGPFEILHEFMPLLTRSTAARVVNMSSDMGSLTHMNNPQSHVYGVTAGAYRASKTALNALTAMFAREWKGTPHKINSASPGWSRTDMGGDAAPLSVAEGADTAVWLATLPADGANGGFFSATRQRGAMEW